MSNNNKFIVMGEASESEGEDDMDLRNYNIPKAEINSTKGVKSLRVSIISGEASESEDERIHNQAVSEAAAKEKEMQEYSNKRKLNEQKYRSLLHKKLRERNESLRKNICDVYNLNTGSAIKQLSGINQQLLKSQITAQIASSAMVTATQMFRAINEKLKATVDDSFIPEITIPSRTSHGS